MCFAYGSIEQAIGTCPMCRVFKPSAARSQSIQMPFISSAHASKQVPSRPGSVPQLVTAPPTRCHLSQKCRRCVDHIPSRAADRTFHLISVPAVLHSAIVQWVRILQGEFLVPKFS
jgi:hypothetical protein